MSSTFASEDLWIGLTYSFLSAGLFGCWFVPIRDCRVKPRDGVFTMWVVCGCVMAVGIFILLIDGNHHFYPLTALGGAFWGAGITMTLWVVGSLGIGPAIIISDIVNCLGNYATGYFGLYGTTARPPRIEWLSFMGLAMVIIGAILVAMVKKKKLALKPSASAPPAIDADGVDPVGCPPSGIFKIPNPDLVKDTTVPSQAKAIKAHVKKFRRPIALFIAVCNGLLFSVCVTPNTTYRDMATRAGWDVPQTWIPYIFSFHAGAFFASTVIFTLYAVAKRHRAYVAGELVLPSLATGLICSVGLLFWFLSVDKLTQGVTGSITAVMPGCVGSLWSVFYYREVRPGSSHYFLGAAIAFTLTGALSIGAAK